jgi:hypothetical protein
MKIIIKWPATMILACCLHLSSPAQSNKVYSVTGAEWILSFANVKDGGTDVGSIARFSPVVNLQEWINFDVSERYGFFTGLSVRNVGFIYDVPNSNLRKKVRTYNLGLPVGIKIGNLHDGIFFYGGYELELPLNYKEKTFTNDDKTSKFTVWFSGRTPTLAHALFAGIQLPHGTSLKFKYYLNNFYKKSYSEEDATGVPFQPYQNMDVNVFYISLNFFVLKNAYFYYSNKASN